MAVMVYDIIWSASFLGGGGGDGGGRLFGHAASTSRNLFGFQTENLDLVYTSFVRQMRRLKI